MSTGCGGRINLLLLLCTGQIIIMDRDPMYFFLHFFLNEVLEIINIRLHWDVIRNSSSVMTFEIIHFEMFVHYKKDLNLTVCNCVTGGEWLGLKDIYLGIFVIHRLRKRFSVSLCRWRYVVELNWMFLFVSQHWKISFVWSASKIKFDILLGHGLSVFCFLWQNRA